MRMRTTEVVVEEEAAAAAAAHSGSRPNAATAVTGSNDAAAAAAAETAGATAGADDTGTSATHTLPLISVCIPVYDGSTMIQDAIQSVWNQTYRGPIELLVSIDWSYDTNATMQRIQRFLQEDREYNNGRQKEQELMTNRHGHDVATNVRVWSRRNAMWGGFATSILFWRPRRAIM